MTGVVAALGFALILGAPAAWPFAQRRPALLVGLSFLYGTGIIYFALLLCAIAGASWTRLSIAIAAVLLAGGAAALARIGDPGSAPAEDADEPVARFGWIGDVATAVSTVAFFLYATLAPVWEWDFWAIWGLKARVFFEARGIDWHFLASRWNDFNHPTYPLLLPANFACAAVFEGRWDDRWMGVFTVAFGVALLLVVRSIAALEVGRFSASLLTFAATPFAFSRYIGTAEAPLLAFGSAAVLLLRRAVVAGDESALSYGAVLLGLAASSKNEGVALIAAVAGALAITRSKWVWRLWPALAVIAPWTILRFDHAFPSLLTRGAMFDRVFHRLPYAGVLGQSLVAALVNRWAWLAIVAAICIAPSALRKRERFVLFATGLQLAAFIAVYFATPLPDVVQDTPAGVRWDLLSSWPRLTRQIGVPILVAAGIMLHSMIRKRTSSAAAAE